MDIYDKEIERLTTAYAQNPRSIYRSWEEADPLFKIIGCGQSKGIHSGCPTMIRSNKYYGAFINGILDKELTEAIRSDENIPKRKENVRPEHLPTFAKWQRRIDLLQNNQQ
jgi:hypothetical protein